MRLYNSKKIQIFVMNMTYFISHLWLRHSWNIYFFTSVSEIQLIFMTRIWISSIYLWATIVLKTESLNFQHTFVLWKPKPVRNFSPRCTRFKVCILRISPIGVGFYVNDNKTIVTSKLMHVLPFLLRMGGQALLELDFMWMIIKP